MRSRTSQVWEKGIFASSYEVNPAWFSFFWQSSLAVKNLKVVYSYAEWYTLKVQIAKITISPFSSERELFREFSSNSISKLWNELHRKWLISFFVSIFLGEGWGAANAYGQNNRKNQFFYSFLKGKIVKIWMLGQKGLFQSESL